MHPWLIVCRLLLPRADSLDTDTIEALRAIG
jgi:hypothetical protein